MVLTFLSVAFCPGFDILECSDNTVINAVFCSCVDECNARSLAVCHTESTPRPTQQLGSWPVGAARHPHSHRTTSHKQQRRGSYRTHSLRSRVAVSPVVVLRHCLPPRLILAAVSDDDKAWDRRSAIWLTVTTTAVNQIRTRSSRIDHKKLANPLSW